ncbi:MAG TPA: hypothetical protein VMC06_06535 [Opitutaceae bacterium]|nr:hypothetical protein [Opitutaceae bacterium]
MSLLLATLLPGLVLAALGGALLSGNTLVPSTLKSFPRSTNATVVFFGGASGWFLYQVWNLSPADFGEYHVPLFFGFAAVAALSFWCVPDFLAVRGLAALVLLAAMPLLEAGYMNYQPQVYPLKIFVYLCIALAIWIGATPYRLRDFFEWMFRTSSRPRVVGSALLGYGVLLGIMAFSY